MLGQALVATNDRARGRGSDHAPAQTRLRASRNRAEAYSQLAMAYGRKGDLAQADLASAQAAFMRGDFKTARELATRAKTRFPVGSPGWVKADDIVELQAAGAADAPATNRDVVESTKDRLPMTTLTCRSDWPCLRSPPRLRYRARLPAAAARAQSLHAATSAARSSASSANTCSSIPSCCRR